MQRPSRRPTGRSATRGRSTTGPTCPPGSSPERLDRLFPPGFVAALARERAGVEVDLVDTGHLAALADPDALVDLLDRYAREAASA